MGRTVLPFSMVLAEQQKRLGQFRRTLRKQDQELLMNCLNAPVQAAVQAACRTDGIDLHLCADRNAQSRKICKRALTNWKRSCGMQRSEPQNSISIRNLQSAICNLIEGWLFDIDELGPLVTLWVYDDGGRLTG